MKLPFGIEIVRNKALANPGGSWSVIHDFYSGAFQEGLPALTDTQMTQQACVYACRTLIANSIAKMPLNQIQLIDGAWQKVPEQYEFLSRPSRIANRITWVSYAVNSMLAKGAVFGLKRYEGGELRYIELLHPSTEVLVSEMGETFFRLSANIYSHLPETTRTVPGRHIFHVPYNTLVHPLIGVPPLEAARAAALSGSAIMTKQARTHANRPDVYGFLKLPVTLSDAQAAAAKQAWQDSNGADGAGVAVLRNGVDFQALQMTARESESAAAMTLANEDIARAFGVPKHLLGIGTIPSAANAEALMLGFYAQTLQPIAELLELALDEALNLPANIGVEFDVKALSRLDSKGRAEAHQIELHSGKISINEARAEEGLPPVPGGEVPYRQMQDIPVNADPEPEPVVEPAPETTEDEELDKAQLYQVTKDVARTEAEVKALQDRMARLPDDLAAVSSSIAELKSFVEKLASQVEAQRNELEARMKAADDARSALEQKHREEIEALRSVEPDTSSVDALTKEVAALKAELAEARIESDKTIKALDGSVSALSLSLVEKSDSHKAELEKVANSIPSVPEIPDGIIELPETVKGMVAELTARVDAAEKMADGCMRFAGAWDEEAEYETGSTVAHKNALWIATRDKPGVPGTRDSGWKMGMKAAKLTTPYEPR